VTLPSCSKGGVDEQDLNRLQTELKRSIEREDYSEAAKLRCEEMFYVAQLSSSSRRNLSPHCPTSYPVACVCNIRALFVTRSALLLHFPREGDTLSLKFKPSLGSPCTGI